MSSIRRIAKIKQLAFIYSCPVHILKGKVSHYISNVTLSETCSKDSLAKLVGGRDFNLYFDKYVRSYHSEHTAYV